MNKKLEEKARLQQELLIKAKKKQVKEKVTSILKKYQDFYTDRCSDGKYKSERSYQPIPTKLELIEASRDKDFSTNSQSMRKGIIRK